MSITIAIVGSSKKDREHLAAILNAYTSEKHLNIQLIFFESADALLAKYRPLLYTIIFLDIHMDGLTGIEAAEKIRETDVDTVLIFLTSSKKCLEAAFHTHAFDYIEKPASRKCIYHVMDDLIRRIDASLLSMPSLSFTSNRRTVHLDYTDIMAVSSADHYLDIMDANGTVYRTRMPFSSVSGALLTDSRFLLIIRGVLVNLDYVQNFANGACRLKGDRFFPYTLRKEKQLIQIWQNYTLSKKRRKVFQKQPKTRQ